MVERLRRLERRWVALGAAAILPLVGLPIGLLLADGSDDGDRSADAIESGAAEPGPTSGGEDGSAPGAAARGPDDTGGSDGGAAGGPGAGGAGGFPPGVGADEPAEPVGRVPPDAGVEEDRAAVELVVRTYLQAISRNAGRTACAQMTADGQRGVVRKVSRIAPEVRASGCQGAIVLYRGALGPISDPRIREVSVDGDRGRAVGPLDQVATLVKQGDVWLLTNYGQ